MKKVAHKVAYIAGGIIIGVVFSTSAGAFADTVKSMVGKKVTGEYTVIVDGEKLSDKGAVIDSRANVPARALSDALGADVTVSGKTITITSNTESSNSEVSTVVDANNKYMGQSKSSLEESRKTIQEKVLDTAVSERAKVAATLEELKNTGDKNAIALAEKRLAEYDTMVTDGQKELALIDAALAAAK
ncbi:stalk domain-containing protein [Paenibacillus amylolyticus]|uniref:stalk domain-containing protein n=1 Tax=Paenibacillus amylolyticus TaxID=1451 RepID=UPI000B8353B7|nr:hypothetical protein [Paenibacillus amylolyticus]